MAIERCKPCANPHDSGDTLKYLPTGLTQCVLNNLSKRPPPYHVTQDDVSAPLQRLEVEKITSHQSVRGRGGVIAVLYKTHWVGLSEPSWEREMDLHLSRSHIVRLLGRRSEPTAKPTVSTTERGSGGHSVSSPATTGNIFWCRATLVFTAPSGSIATTIRCFLRRSTFCTRETIGCGFLETSVPAQPRARYIWSDFWTAQGPFKFLFSRRDTRLQRGPYEAFGAYKFTPPAHFPGGSNVT